MIQPGEVVVLKLHDEKSSYVIQAENMQKIARQRVLCNAMVGYPHGSVFELGQDRGLVFIPAEEYNEENVNLELYLPDTEKGDNRHYVDSNTAQKLTDGDIQKLKKGGATGTEIIQSLISNSDTWSTKTIFAQEKWIKKKQQKYAKKVRILKATPANICDVYNNKGRDKVCGIRNDTLAQILFQSGISAGSKVIVFESMLGLIAGSVAYQLRGYGQILALYDGQQPHFEVIKSLNLDDASCDIVQPVPCCELAVAVDYVLQYGFIVESTSSSTTAPTDDGLSSSSSTAAVVTSSSSSSSSSLPINHLVTTETTSMDVAVSELERKNISSITTSAVKRCRSTSTTEGEDHDQKEEINGRNNCRSNSNNNTNSSSHEINKNRNNRNNSKNKNNDKQNNLPPEQSVIRRYNTSGRQGDDLQLVRQLLRQGSNSLIIASKYHPLPVLRECVSLLGPSSPLVVFCEFMEPLVECYLYLQSRGDCLRLRLCDTWLREFQTLPGRVHPEMYMQTSGGYLLLGIYVGMPPIISMTMSNDSNSSEAPAVVATASSTSNSTTADEKEDAAGIDDVIGSASSSTSS